MKTREERAAQRRATWTGGVASSFEEMEAKDMEYWLSLSPTERVGLVWSLVCGALVLGGREPAPRLQRSIGGVLER
ncbi:MAG: hypothetical protein AAF938_19335 [Myxococcota bacterium]